MELELETCELIVSSGLAEETSRILDEILADHLAKEEEATALERQGVQLPLHGSPSNIRDSELGWDPSQPRGGALGLGGHGGGGGGIGSLAGRLGKQNGGPFAGPSATSPGRLGGLSANSDPRLLWEALVNLRYAKEALEMDYDALLTELTHERQLGELMKKVS